MKQAIRYITPFIIVLLSICISFATHAADSPFELQATSGVKINYSPFSGLPGSESLEINLELNNQARAEPEAAADEFKGRRYGIRLKPLNDGKLELSGPGQTLPLELIPVTQKPQGFRFFNNEYTQNFSVDGPRVRPLKFNYNVVVPASIYTGPGSYLLSLQLEFIDSETEEVFADTRVDIEVVVAAKLYTSIAGTSQQRSAFPTIDFGILKTGKSRRISMQIRGNVIADISITSENQGRLRLVDDQNVYIDYSVEVDGKSSDLKLPLRLSRAIPRNLRGSAYPMTIKLGNVRGAYEGAYEDIITIEVRPQ